MNPLQRPARESKVVRSAATADGESDVWRVGFQHPVIQIHNDPVGTLGSWRIRAQLKSESQEFQNRPLSFISREHVIQVLNQICGQPPSLLKVEGVINLRSS